MQSTKHRVLSRWMNGREWKDSLGMYHREHGPAIEMNDGEKGWMRFGKWHRVGGPAREYNDGHRVWLEDDVTIRASDSEEETT